MANYAYYELMAVSKDRAVLERLIGIMDYNDPAQDKLHMHRVFSATDDEIEQHGDLYSMRVYGEVAWGCTSWFEDEPGKEPIKHGPDTLSKVPESRYTTLPELTGLMDLAVECYCEECGCAFAEHYAARKGECYIGDSETWFDQSIDSEKDLGDLTDDYRKVYDREMPEDDLKRIRDIYERYGSAYVSLGGFGFDFSDVQTIYDGKVPNATIRGPEYWS